MQKILTAIVIATLFAACGDPPTPDPCLNVSCGANGTCQNGSCVCIKDWFGDKCDKHFDTSQCLKMEVDGKTVTRGFVIGSTDAKKLTVSGETGDAAKYNGRYVDVLTGSVDKNTLFCLLVTKDVNPPSGERILPGLGAFLVDSNQPLLNNGKANFVSLRQKVKTSLYKKRGRIQLYSEQNGTYTPLATDFTEEGSIAYTDNLDSLYMFDKDPIIAATVELFPDGHAEINFTGTSDEDSTSPDLLQFTGAVDGTPLPPLTAVANGGGLKFTANLPSSFNKLAVTVTDTNNNSASKEFTNCMGKSLCEPYQTCRGLDSVCVGSDPCSPNPCAHGTCSSSSGSPVCTCEGGWKGNLCDQPDLCYNKDCGHGSCKQADGGTCQCNAGYDGATCNTCASGYIDNDPSANLNCIPDPCIGENCNGHGSCSSATGVAICACTGHYNPADKCATCAPGWEGAGCNTQNLCYGISCPDDSLFCNGTEYCNPANGQCEHKDAPTCNSHGTCNESTDICDCIPNFGGATCNQCASGTIGTYPNCLDDPCLPTNPCQNGGSCTVSGTSPVCVCTNHWDPSTSCATCAGHWNISTNCTTCLGGWMGSDCNTVDVCYGQTCSGHGSCQYPGGNCSCNTGYTGATCNACAFGYGPLYPTCNPVPTISGLAIDCSSTGGYCYSAGTYPVSWNFTNATSFNTQLQLVSGSATDAGSVSPASGSLSGSSKTISWTLGDPAPAVGRLTVTVSGPGGNASASIDVNFE